MEIIVELVLGLVRIWLPGTSREAETMVSLGMYTTGKTVACLNLQIGMTNQKISVRTTGTI